MGEKQTIEPMKIVSSRKELKASRQIWPLSKMYYSKARQAKAEGKPVVWTLGLAPPEILHALGVIPVMPEHYTSVLAVKQRLTPYLEWADTEGYPFQSCPYHRGTLGYVYSDEEQMIPLPDLILAMNFCDGGNKYITPIIKRFQVPCYYIDLPYLTQPADEQGRGVPEEAIEYCAGQLKEVVAFVEEATGTSHDPAHFQQTLLWYNEALALWREINELRKAVPCPMGVVDEVGDIYPLMQLAGTREAVAVYQMLLAEVKARVAAGEGILDEERYRLIWLGVSPNYDTGILNYFEKFGAVLVKSDLDYLYGEIDLEDPFRGMARKLIHNYYHVVVENRLEMTRKLIVDYQGEGVVCYAPRGCRQTCGTITPIRDLVQKELGLPLLSLEGNQADMRGYDGAHLRGEIERFLEMLG